MLHFEAGLEDWRRELILTRERPIAMEEKVVPGSLVASFFSRQATTFKLAGIIVLILLLLIPLGMIRSVLSDRLERRNQAISGITSTWGEAQELVGPVLAVPYQETVKSWKNELIDGRTDRIEVVEEVTRWARFLPAHLSIEGEIEPTRLHRGIYEAVVYDGDLNLTGSFETPDLSTLGINADAVAWDQARVTLAISDLRGIGEMLEIRLGDKDYTLTPGVSLPGYSSGVSAEINELKGDAGDSIEFMTRLPLKGSRSLRFAPVGRQNTVKLSSPWTAPSFNGAYLPAEREVGAEGFTARWDVSWYARSYPQQSAGKGDGDGIQAGTIRPSMFGVDLIIPVDAYRMVERAIKYGLLFITLIFTAFFLFEILSQLRIHPIQYTLVGAALCLFYLAVLSLSEFIAFGYAYLIGAVASTALIALYSLKVLGSGRRCGVIAACLAGIYGYLYGVLQMQDYSLLFGTAGLFVALAIVMYSTRNLDWSAGGIPQKA